MNDKNPFPPRHKRISLGQGAIVVLLLFILLGNVFYLGYKFYERNTLSTPSADNGIQKLALVQKILAENYLYSDEVPYEQVFDGAVEGMASSLGDPYTRYVSEREYEEFRIQTEGSFGGIGVSVDVNKSTEDGIVIATINEGDAADLAGLKPNDRIIEVDGKPIEGMNVEDAIALIRGEIGTDVQLKIMREGEKEPITVILQRSKVELENIISEIKEDNVGYIQLVRFSRDISSQFEEEYKKLEKEGIESLIIDLRSNPGGLFEEASKIASFFIGGNKELVTVESKNYTYPVKTDSANLKIDIPTVILVDQFSASASEILAGALSSYEKVTVVGETTYGKGLMQNTIPIDEESALIVTVSEYVTPSGEYINGNGITPDIEVSNTPEEMLVGEDSQLNKAIEFLTKESE